MLGGRSLEVEDMADAARGKILIIDDDELMRTTLEAILGTAGYETATAANGRRGLDWLEQNSVDIVITDIYMPEQEGIETIIELRQNYPSIKVVAISGGGEAGTPSMLEFAEKLGAMRALHKPFTVDQVIGLVKELLDPEAEGSG